MVTYQALQIYMRPSSKTTERNSAAWKFKQNLGIHGLVGLHAYPWMNLCGQRKRNTTQPNLDLGPVWAGAVTGPHRAPQIKGRFLKDKPVQEYSANGHHIGPKSKFSFKSRQLPTSIFCSRSLHTRDITIFEPNWTHYPIEKFWVTTNKRTPENSRKFSHKVF